ncbi:Na(+)/H(+) antiporter subunit C [Cellulomonas carbonis]|uniref:NADH-ubiquinone oxidoreductase subunit 4L n=1 Tax=Cellulomonas carbonis T26 TaxID=947969 RepID=A0A0A0BUR1_9CELL|nr:Na(+)/H(+) antiporter subunit C [Cellulomonas carbonis]KGM10879.1 NADH-ubiquinone oxidoreductase subunit 4L [Cellulomonas carbonis T26]GGC00387.1 sodium:proton antiporter [Cellulomonas carbonis]
MIDTAPNLTLVVVAGALAAVGVYLLLERSLTRVLLGVIFLSNAVNVVFLVAGGRAGGAPIIGSTDEDAMSDPLPQAMVLTAIVITLGMTAFLLALAYRSWQLNHHDEVQDDLEDRRVAARAAADLAAYESDDDETRTLEQEAADVHDETGAPVGAPPEPDAAPGSRRVESAEGGDVR